MAYNDTLFQLGMDLTRSSPAQEEDSIDQVQVLHGDRTNDGVSKYSSRLYINLSGAKAIGSAKAIERSLGDALSFVKALVVRTEIGRANARGWIAGSALLADGYVTIDACPARGLVAIDVVSSSGIRPDCAMTAFADAFAAREVILKKERTAAEIARMRQPVIELSGAKALGNNKHNAASSGAKLMRARAA